MRREGVAHFREFSQQNERLKSDKQLQTMIMARQISHDGNPLLRQHIDNANAKKYGDGSSNESSIRIVKRSDSLKIDAAVSVSMGVARILHYNVV
jgi:phage terminase large subunit-like protein